MAGLHSGSVHLTLAAHDVSDTAVRIIDSSVLVDIPGDVELTLEFPVGVFIAWLNELEDQADREIARAVAATKTAVG